MKRSSNVKRSSMDKRFKVSRLIPFAAFGGIFYLATQESQRPKVLSILMPMSANHRNLDSASNVRLPIRKRWQEQSKTHHAIPQSMSVKMTSTRMTAITVHAITPMFPLSVVSFSVVLLAT